jgi:hypothetical protein
MESIIDYLQRKLKDAGPTRWEAIASVVSDSLPEGVKQPLSFHSLRKIAYGERPNLGTLKGEALRDFFLAVEAGEVELPEPAKQAA